MHQLIDQLPVLGDTGGTLVHVGCGSNPPANRYNELFERVYLIDGAEQVSENLRKLTKELPNISVECAFISSKNCTSGFYKTNNQNFDSLVLPTGLDRFYPNLKVKEERSVSAVSISKQLRSLELSSSRNNVLILDLWGIEDSLIGVLPDEILHLFSLVVLKSFIGAKPESSDAIAFERQVKSRCFDSVAKSEADFPFHTIVYRRNDQKIRLRELETKLEDMKIREQGLLELLKNRPSIVGKKYASDICETRSSAVYKDCQAQQAGLPAQVILVAGMRHSGSTALFNILRLALSSAGIRFFSGYSDYINLSVDLNGYQVALIKTHEVCDQLLGMATCVIRSVRDLRDTVASAKRRDFKLMANLGGEVAYAKYNRVLDDVWRPLSDYCFVYEQFMANPELQIRKLLDFLDLHIVDLDELVAQVMDLPENDYKKTLLTPTHITDKNRELSFSDTLDDDVILSVERDSKLWLTANNYRLSKT